MTATESNADKERLDMYGANMAPIPATEVYTRPLPHFSGKGIKGEAWILINSHTGVVVHANTYNGKVGRRWKPREFPLVAEKVPQKTKGYDQVAICDCPIATEAVASSNV